MDRKASGGIVGGPTVVDGNGDASDCEEDLVAPEAKVLVPFNLHPITRLWPRR